MLDSMHARWRHRQIPGLVRAFPVRRYKDHRDQALCLSRGGFSKRYGADVLGNPFQFQLTAGQQALRCKILGLLDRINATARRANPARNAGTLIEAAETRGAPQCPPNLSSASRRATTGAQQRAP